MSAFLAGWWTHQKWFAPPPTTITKDLYVFLDDHVHLQSSEFLTVTACTYAGYDLTTEMQEFVGDTKAMDFVFTAPLLHSIVRGKYPGITQEAGLLKITYY